MRRGSLCGSARRASCAVTMIGMGLVPRAPGAADVRAADYGARLPGGGEAVLWTVDSGWKVGRTKPAPTNAAEAVVLRAARNEAEAAQLVLTPSAALTAFTIAAGPLAGPEGASIPAESIEVLRVRYVEVTQPSDPLSAPGAWPDPLPPIRAPLTLEAGVNHPFWIRIAIPRDAAAGTYLGALRLSADGWSAEVPLRAEVFDFALPDRMSCATAFGFSPGTAFRYHGIRDDSQKRVVLEKYWASFASHHISPYDPAPLDPIRVRWPDVKPPPAPWADWTGATPVTNEARSGCGALVIFDDRRDATPTVAWRHRIAIPPQGLRLRFHHRTALPDHTFLVSLNHHDADGKWMSGRNNDVHVRGNGSWQGFDRTFTKFPEGAKSVVLSLRATEWSEDGAKTGLVWYDDVELLDAGTGAALVRGGDFEPAGARPPVAPPEGLRAAVDFAAWDREMERVFARHHFNTFRLAVQGMGGGTFEGISAPSLLGFTEDAPEYAPLFASYAGALAAHLKEKGWLDRAYVYWFDEPDEHQYGFVRRGFERLRRFAPGLRGMLTEQVEPELVGGPALWCPVSSSFDVAKAAERRKAGEHFWWYVCCSPKAPATGLFIDHAGTEMRVWLWQTWQRGIEGILVWETDHWTSAAAYPDPAHPQNPYADPMGWVSSGPRGQKRPWGNGDGRFLYPPEAAATPPAAPVIDGPVDSIRWEMLRDGIEDYEYLAILRGLLEEKGASLADSRRAELRALLEVPPEITADLTHFTKDPLPIQRRREALARAIASLGGR